MKLLLLIGIVWYMSREERSAKMPAGLKEDRLGQNDNISSQVDRSFKSENTSNNVRGF